MRSVSSLKIKQASDDADDVDASDVDLQKTGLS